MAECQGAIILGLRQINVLDAVLKEGTIQESRSMPSNFLPTPWDQLEAGMAFMLGLPTLIIKEDRVWGGVFDVGSSDRFVHQVSLPSEVMPLLTSSLLRRYIAQLLIDTFCRAAVVFSKAIVNAPLRSHTTRWSL